MGFKASNLQVGGETQKIESSSTSVEKTQVELSERELEFLLVTIKNGFLAVESPNQRHVTEIAHSLA